MPCKDCGCALYKNEPTWCRVCVLTVMRRLQQIANLAPRRY